MDNQHKKIKGYRDLSKQEIALMNKGKELAEEVGKWANEVKGIEGVDPRWLSIGTEDLQKGFMGLTRAIARPTTF